MELINIRDDDRTSDLYGAALRGDEQTLQQLLQRDASILANIPGGLQTPLHISTLLGHLPFTVALLHHDRHDLALRADSCGRTALHLASAKGHINIVRELLQVNNKQCLNRDAEGRIPLHYAAMRGRTEVVQELVMARPDSLGLVDLEGSTAFHLCVIHNHLNTLETLVELHYATANVIPPPIFKYSDRAGNTILHLAIMFKRVEVVSYLLSISKMKETANLKNKKGFTANDIFEQSPKDFKICEIQHLLAYEAEEHEGFDETDHPYPHPPPKSTDDVVVPPPLNDNSCIKMFKWMGNHFMRFVRWIGDRLEHDDEWLKEMRGNLSLVATVIATITFQALINPPGGFIQPDLSSSSSSSSSSKDNPLSCSVTLDEDGHGYCAGRAVFPSSPDFVDDYETHFASITVSFFASLGVTLLLVSGVFPMKNRAVIWVASVGMCITLRFLALAYESAISLIIPLHLLKEAFVFDLRNTSFEVWSRLLEIIMLIITLRFFIWVVKKCHTMFNKLRKWAERGNERRHRRRRFLLPLLRIILIFGILVIFSALSFLLYSVFFSGF